MATYRVLSGTGGATGADWANAVNTIAEGLALITADGDILLVDQDHTENPSAAITWTLPDFKFAWLVVDKDNADALSTGADVTPGTGNHAFTINNGTGNTEIYGMEFSGATNSGSTADILLDIANGSDGGNITFRNCKIKLPGTSSGASFFVGSTSLNTGTRRALIAFDGCEFTLPNRAGGACITIGHARVVLRNGCTFVYNGASHPNPVFIFGATAAASELEITDCDLSNLDSASLFDIASLVSGRVTLRNVALNAGIALTTSSWAVGNASITCINVDSGDTFTTFSYRDRYGTLSNNASVYADDNVQFGATNMGLQVVTSAVCDEFTPFRLPPLKKWNNSTSTASVTIEFIHDSTASMHNRNIWSRLRYIGSSSLPSGTVSSTRNGNPFIGTSSNHAAGIATWTGTGGFTAANKQRLVHNVTAGEKGDFLAEIAIGTASKTLYLDPQLRGV